MSTEELVEGLKAQHPNKRLRAIETAAGTIVCVNPSRPQYNLYMQMLWDDDKANNAKAHETLLLACCVHPEAKTLRSWLEDYPGISSDKDVVLALRQLAGAAKEAGAKS